MEHVSCRLRNLDDIRQLVLTRLQQVTHPSHAQSMDHAAALISQLVTIICY